MLFPVRHRSPAATGPPPDPATSPSEPGGAAGTPRLIGRPGTVVYACGRVGRAAVCGDIWEIDYPAGLLRAGQRVRVVGQWGDLLLVIPADDDDPDVVGGRRDDGRVVTPAPPAPGAHSSPATPAGPVSGR